MLSLQLLVGVIQRRMPQANVWTLTAPVRSLILSHYLKPIKTKPWQRIRPAVVLAARKT